MHKPVFICTMAVNSMTFKKVCHFCPHPGHGISADKILPQGGWGELGPTPKSDTPPPPMPPPPEF